MTAMPATIPPYNYGGHDVHAGDHYNYGVHHVLHHSCRKPSPLTIMVVLMMTLIVVVMVMLSILASIPPYNHGGMMSIPATVSPYNHGGQDVHAGDHPPL